MLLLIQRWVVKFCGSGLGAWVAVVLCHCAFLDWALAAPQPAAAKLRSEYFRLRNVDPTGTDGVQQGSWDRLGLQIRGYLAKPSFDDNSIGLRLLGADVHLRLFRRTRRNDYLTAARSLLEPLVGGERGKAVARDLQATAYLLRGDAAVYGRDEELAEHNYLRASALVGDSARRARQRLIGLRNGTYARLMPATDLEVPRLVPSKSRGSVGSNMPMIVLDPGHGGEDVGALSSIGGEEKEITLDVARRVRKILEHRFGYRVRLTRESDEFVPLARRTAMANLKDADVFISLHVNASPEHTLRGLEVYYLDNTNDEASRKLAERENGVAPGDSVDDLSFMLSDLIQSGKLEDSILLSRSVEGALKRSVIAPHRELRSLGVKKAPFFVLVGAHMPCSLIEMFFIDNSLEGRKLQQDSFRAALAVGVADGIRSFLLKR
jgi:N-acetylmuramoyl-L-alanine amidase